MQQFTSLHGNSIMKEAVPMVIGGIPHKQRDRMLDMQPQRDVFALCVCVCVRVCVCVCVCASSRKVEQDLECSGEGECEVEREEREEAVLIKRALKLMRAQSPQTPTALHTETEINKEPEGNEHWI
ncbi:hypothetical protein CCH79_00006604 [Gambusia affinis]|uniref:Uncharacterized protein n=1 Tax=Gambusia affinis TaxID=33528 RepID=A0A315WPY5_GAMAF|nr:hypothetical protein CCH79_00006604 [Gambusia affinis]